RAQVARAPKRWSVVEALASGEPVAVDELARLIPGAKTAVRELAKAGVVELAERELPLDAVATGDGMHVSAPPTLTAEQTVAVDTIVGALTGGEWSPFLLHGITGSGKTEVYLRVIAEALAAGKTALVL